jgi:hypothetical protein
MKKVLLLILSFAALTTFAQDDLLGELEKSNSKEVDYTIATFKGTRLVNGHTIEVKDKKSLEFIFQHRFGTLNGGAYELFGLDQASVRLGLDYGIADNLSLSLSRNSIDKTIDSYLKYKFLRQQSGAKTVPFTITALGGIAYKTSPRKEDAPAGFEDVDRIAYNAQLFIARKFSPNLSLQIMPTFIHRNAVNQAVEENDQIALGIGGRLKVTRSIALTSEYYYRLSAPDNDLLPNGQKLYNSIGFGIDIETGGHVFQLIMTNATGLTERAFVTETTGDFFDGDIRFGFNVSRGFQLGGRKK